MTAYSCPSHLAHVAGAVYQAERRRYASRAFTVGVRPEATGRERCQVCKGAACWEVRA